VGDLAEYYIEQQIGDAIEVKIPNKYGGVNMSETNFKIETAFKNNYNGQDWIKLTTPNGTDYAVWETDDVDHIKRACNFQLQNLKGCSISGAASKDKKGRDRLVGVHVSGASHNFDAAGGIGPETVDGARKGNCFKTITELVLDQEFEWWPGRLERIQGKEILLTEIQACFPDTPKTGSQVTEEEMPFE